jgi:hypothetical protein
MAKKTAIPSEIKEAVQAIVDAYNVEYKLEYAVVFKGAFCYFSRFAKRPLLSSIFIRIFSGEAATSKIETKLARLTWTGNMDKWNLAIFLYSRETYTTDYWGFPGSEKFNGTVLSVLNCNLYPD